jgi:hypothetical protein
MNLPLRDPIPTNVVQELVEEILFEASDVDEANDEGESRNLRVGYGSDMVFGDRVEGFRRPRAQRCYCGRGSV